METLQIVREWIDALVIAFVLAMFVRVFVVELFKIPTGSMTPTLLGDVVADVDVDGDGLKDLVVRGSSQLVFINKGDRYEVDEAASAKITQARMEEWMAKGLFHAEYDRILVNKFAFWTHPPRRGDVIVFKVPDAIWDPGKPIYIKRACGLPGETISFRGRLKVGDELVNQPEFYQHQNYTADINPGYMRNFRRLSWFDYEKGDYASLRIRKVKVPEDGVFAMGDNTNHSLDSRYWGAVPLDNLKGKAFLRYWPLKKLKFIR